MANGQRVTITRLYSRRWWVFRADGVEHIIENGGKTDKDALSAGAIRKALRVSLPTEACKRIVVSDDGGYFERVAPRRRHDYRIGGTKVARRRVV